MSESAAAPAPSLQRMLLGWLLVPLVGLVPLAVATLYLLAVRPALDGLDRALTDSAVALSRLLVDRDGQAELTLSPQTEQVLRADLVDRNYFAVLDPGNRLLVGDAVLAALAPRAAPLRPGDWAFFDAELAGVPVRVAAHVVACAGAQRCPIVVAESLSKRHAAERAVLGAALVTALGIALVLGAVAMFAVRRGLRPLRLAAADLDARTLDRLEPIDLRAAPREVASFVRALNDLFGRLRVGADAQRHFVADAAHQLRTPLATIRSDAAQALAAEDAQARRAILQRLEAAAERGSRLVQQLLTLARSGDGAVEFAAAAQPVDLRALAGASAEDWLAPSLAAGQDLGYELADASVHGHPALLRELLGNLIHNAIVHAGRGATITVRCGVAGTRAYLEVEDDGPGIPPHEQAAVWERFRRGSHHPGTGSGLGLAIVRDIARLHHADATLQAGAGGRGLRVRVDFA